MISNLPLTNYLSVIFCFVALWLRLGLVGGLCTFDCQPVEKWHWYVVHVLGSHSSWRRGALQTAYWWWCSSGACSWILFLVAG